ncbi:TetR/AcrR family transcriptional regulator [Arenibacterium sp. CAU 1754]
MRNEKRQTRQAEIFAAAYAVLSDKGYGGASMLNIAKAAKASNETMYRWYGDKKGLFKAMVQANAGDVKQALSNALEHQDDPRRSLADIAPILLTALMGDRAVFLNRAAAADHTGELGAAISEGGRTEIVPLIEALMQSAIEAGALTAPSARQASEWYVSLLIGDLQIRRVTGALPPLSADAIAARAEGALAAFDRLTA